MKLLRSRTGRILALLYLSLFGIVLLFVVSIIVFDPSHSEFVGIYLLFVTIPWSLFYSKLMTTSPYINIIIHIAEALQNGIILYVIGALIDKGQGKEGVSSGT